VSARRAGLSGARRGRGPRAFSLLEVLIALAVLALVMAALLRALGSEAAGLAERRERLFAQWVAADVLAEARLAGVPPVGRRSGRSEQGGLAFAWTLEVQPSGVAGLRRMQVAVRREDAPDAPVLTLDGFAGP
jgi:general secretion pathway protein I